MAEPATLYDGAIRIYTGDCREVLRALPEASVHCVVTSPPYYGLRSYKGVEPTVWRAPDLLDCPYDCAHEWGALERGKKSDRAPKNGLATNDAIGASEFAQGGAPLDGGRFCQLCGSWRGTLGNEPTPSLYVAHLVEVFRELWRVLRPEGSVWLNLGDSYSNDGKWGGASGGKHVKALHGNSGIGRERKATGLKPKDLIGVPWMVAFALRDAGWWLREEIIWCLSGGARVYARTQKGEMPMRIKDLVRLRPETVQLWNGERWTQALGWSEAPREDALEIELRSGERIGCTPHHEWPTTKGGRLRADELRVGDELLSTTLPEPESPASPAWLPDEETGWLVGTYLADGSRDGTTLRIASHRNEVPRFERLRRIVAACHGTLSLKAGSPNGVDVSLEGRVLSAVVETYLVGTSAYDKHLSTAAWQRSNAFLRGVMDGYLAGDGHWDEKNRRWRLGFTENHQLAADLRTLAARLGWRLRLRARWATFDGRAFPMFRGEVRTELSGHWNVKADTEIVAIRRSRGRRFWHIGVADEPHVFALASGVLTGNSKPAPMPESVEDRCTRAHEQVFHLTKAAHYYHDAVAIAEPGAEPDRVRADQGGGANGHTVRHSPGAIMGSSLTRNKRTVWTIGPEPFPEAHFAVMPTALAEPCVLAGTSAKGVCQQCGAPWERRERRKPMVIRRSDLAGKVGNRTYSSGTMTEPSSRTTIGWTPTCRCRGQRGQVVPATVLDPFGGAGTTALVAWRLGRAAISMDASAEYVALQEKRLAGQAPLYA